MREGGKRGLSASLSGFCFWISGEQLEADGLSRGIRFNFVLDTCRRFAGLQTPPCVLQERRPDEIGKRLRVPECEQSQRCQAPVNDELRGEPCARPVSEC